RRWRHSDLTRTRSRGEAWLRVFRSRSDFHTALARELLRIEIVLLFRIGGGPKERDQRLGDPYGFIAAGEEGGAVRMPGAARADQPHQAGDAGSDVVSAVRQSDGLHRIV